MLSIWGCMTSVVTCICTGGTRNYSIQRDFIVFSVIISYLFWSHPPHNLLDAGYTVSLVLFGWSMVVGYGLKGYTFRCYKWN